MFSEKTQAIILCTLVVLTLIAGFGLYNWQQAQADIERQKWLESVKGSPVASATCQRDIELWEAGQTEEVERRYGARSEGVVALCRTLVDQLERRRTE